MCACVQLLRIGNYLFVEPTATTRNGQATSDWYSLRHLRRDVSHLCASLTTPVPFSHLNLNLMNIPTLASLLQAPSMKLYIDYVNKYDSTLQIVKKYRTENVIFDGFLKAGQEDNDAKGRGFHDFTVMPIQRIPRYVLLLQQIIKYTDASHPDFANIEAALKEVEKIASYINQKKKEYDLTEKVAMVQSCFVPKVCLFVC
jgi:hypothetical protein